MKLEIKAKVENVTYGERADVRVQACGPPRLGFTPQLYFSVLPEHAPHPGDEITVTLEWAAPRPLDRLGKPDHASAEDERG